LVNTMRIVRDGALLSVVVSTYLLVLMRFNPRILVEHYPKEIREIVPPRSEKERRMSILLGLVIGAPFASALLWRAATLGSRSFRELFAYVFGVLFIFNLVDLLVLDCAYRVLVQATLGDPPRHGAYRDSQPLPPSLQGVPDGNRRSSVCRTCRGCSSALSALKTTGAVEQAMMPTGSPTVSGGRQSGT
jgi:hypothetical protein